MQIAELGILYKGLYDCISNKPMVVEISDNKFTQGNKRLAAAVH